MKNSFISEDEFKVLLANRGKVGGEGVGRKPTVSPTRRTSESLERHGSPPNFLLTLAITGQLPSGKNQVQLLFRNGKVTKYPNKTFTNWRAHATVQLWEQRNRTSMAPLITVPVRLTVEYWRGDERTRDLSGQLDALFHLLVYAKVLHDDGLVHDVVWRRQALSRKFPKVWMEIQEMKG